MGISNGNREWGIEIGMGIQIDPEQNRGHAYAQLMMPDIHFLKKIKKHESSNTQNITLYR